MLTWIWLKFSLPAYNAWQEQDRTQVPEKMAIGAKHATICLPSCAVYYAWHRSATRGKAANTSAWHWNLGGYDVGEIDLSALDSRDWWRWLETLHCHWRAMKQEWRKHPISEIQTFIPYLAWCVIFKLGKGFQMLILRCYHAPGFQHAKYFSRS